MLRPTAAATPVLELVFVEVAVANARASVVLIASTFIAPVPEIVTLPAICAWLSASRKLTAIVAATLVPPEPLPPCVPLPVCALLLPSAWPRLLLPLCVGVLVPPLWFLAISVWLVVS
ncbi:MAG: hypothetical protein E5W30_08740 [Mesorhizobium sp.]|nr:MAG: hypothetical protein E5W30_08740 [Mesorhizobium sp.]